jgi:hypothetical protein
MKNLPCCIMFGNSTSQFDPRRAWRGLPGLWNGPLHELEGQGCLVNWPWMSSYIGIIMILKKKIQIRSRPWASQGSFLHLLAIVFLKNCSYKDFFKIGTKWLQTISKLRRQSKSDHISSKDKIPPCFFVIKKKLTNFCFENYPKKKTHIKPEKILLHHQHVPKVLYLH